MSFRLSPFDSDGRPGRLRIYKGHFEDHLAFDKHRHDRDWKSKRMLTEASFEQHDDPGRDLEELLFV